MDENGNRENWNAFLKSIDNQNEKEVKKQAVKHKILSPDKKFNGKKTVMTVLVDKTGNPW